MKKFIVTKDGSSYRIVCEYPKKCPICNKSISPDNKMEFVNKDINMVSILFGCPSCGKGFVSHYSIEDNEIMNGSYKHRKLELINSYPKIPDKYQFDECIKKLSPEFCNIYNEARAAEFYDLNSIAGMGYRKALEFLIKDYSISKKPNGKEKIKNMNLSQVIDEYIDGAKLHSLAKASAWIGNDETHYTKKIEDRDVNDLKRFITSAVAYITYDLTADEAFEMVNS